MEEQFCVVFSSSAELIGGSLFPDRLSNGGENELRTGFLKALSAGDRERFMDFCKKAPDFSRIQGCMSVFRVFNFCGHHYAFAEKKDEEPHKVFVSFYKTARKLNALLSPSYLRFFSTISGVGTSDKLLFSADSEMIKEYAPTLTDMRTEHTNILELTEKTLQSIRADAVFYGNRITLDSPEGLPQRDAEGDYTLCFSTAAYVHVLYALCAALIEATVSHRITASVLRSDLGVEIEIRTTTNPMLEKRMENVTDLTCVAAFADYSENLMAFAGIVAEINSFHPCVSYSPEDGALSVTLCIDRGDSLEGEFRYREPYRDLTVMVKEASRLWNLLTWKDTPLLDEEEQG